MSAICDLLYTKLVRVEKPARYLGAEINSCNKTNFSLHIMACFPDLYEIGMSNNAMRILYSGLNSNDNIFCERVFSPASDFIEILAEKNIPLYGLESQCPVKDSDILAFTVGYELAATNILQILELSGIPFNKIERNESHPIVIAGGPGITNPVPFSSFFDAVWIGEAEDKFFILCAELAQLKKTGSGKSDLMAKIMAHPNFWTPGKITGRNIDESFSSRVVKINYPIPIIKPVQDHGVVEIMRGCPNGCRFCQAGFLYRPCRFKDVQNILDETDILVGQGHHVITLTSLSSGDFPGIFELLDFLNNKYSALGVSFQLPSLKIESFSINIIDKLAKTKKSGLTFAVETPVNDWQRAINKISTLEKILAILLEAEQFGYKLAKFYFMIGLPVETAEYSEEAAIIDFIKEIRKNTKIDLNISIATFVPKPHTPFQRVSQISLENSMKTIYAIKDAFKKYSNVKISYHSPLMSAVEGYISRGDAGVREAILKAYQNGCRFDSWDDHFNKQVWLDILSERVAYDFSGILPWADIKINLIDEYIETQFKHSENKVLSPPCSESCEEICGSCSDDASVKNFESSKTSVTRFLNSLSDGKIIPLKNDLKTRCRLLFKFSKLKESAFFAHQDIWRLISHAFFRSGLPLEYTQGFTPLVHLEISEPLPLGSSSHEEYGIIYLNADYDTVHNNLKSILPSINAFLPESIRIIELDVLHVIDGKKNISLSSVHWGSLFELAFIDTPKSAFDFLNDLLAIKDKNPEILKDLQAQLVDSGLQITLPFSGKKEFGIQGLILQILGVPFRESGLSLIRKNQFAKSADSGNAIDYTSVYK